MLAKLPLLLIVLLLSSLGYAAPLKLYVSPKGNDTWNGKAATRKGANGPFATLAGARDALRAMKKAGASPKGGVIVELQPGVYEMAAAFELTAEDSGTPEAPITYMAKRGAEVRLVGGKQVTNFVPVSDPAVLDRLEPEARGKVMQADLKALGVTNFGHPAADGQRLELFFQDRPMKVSRWPNEGFAKVVDVVGGAPHKIHGIPGDKIGLFTYDGDRPSRWVAEKDPWVHGYWFWDWSDERQRIEKIDTEKKTIALKPPYHGYGYRKGAWWAAFNLLSEIDAPEEYYLDRDTGVLYFYPPAPISSGKSLVSVLPQIIATKDTSNLVLRGFTIEASRGTPVVLGNADNVKLVGCTIRNTGASAVSLSGKNSGVIGCDVYETCNGGIHLSGGDRKTLTPANLVADNNHVHHYARWKRVYQPGITLYGVGNIARNNLIDNAPHMAMGFGGNNHLIEYNEMHSVCYESNDAGAIYTGRDWSMCGTVLRHNYLHHINGRDGKGCVGMYLDDQFGGTQMVGNLFFNVTRATMVGGGRNCLIENNIYVGCVPATHVDARGLGWAAGGFDGLKNKLESWPYKTPPWSEQYPYLVNLLEDEPMAPKYNVIARNVSVGGRWGDFEGKAKPLVTFTDNTIVDKVDDPLVQFAHPEKLADLSAVPLATDFALKPTSPALKLGFQPIPMAKIGLYKSADRASWPVKSEVRPLMGPPPATARAVRTGLVTAKVARRTGAITMDGKLSANEWAGAGLVLEQAVDGTKQTPASQAWVSWDDEALYVAFDNPVNPKFPIHPGNTWGQDDAVEIALANLLLSKNSPIIVLRGFPSGHMESSDEAGASAAVAKKAGEGVQYKAAVVDSKRWTAEWRIPWASLGIDPAKSTKLHFNLSVRKTADDQWIEWQGTGGSTWQVDNGGIIELVK
jgi:hypothetical protein